MGRLLEAASLREVKEAGVPVIPFSVARSPEEVREAAQHFRSAVFVKAHVPAGGRQKGGVISLAPSPDRAADIAAALLGTTFRRYPISEVLVSPAARIRRELFVAVALDESRKGPVVIFSAHGGIDVETLARERPAGVQIFPVNMLAGLGPADAETIVRAGGLRGPAVSATRDILLHLYRLFRRTDARLVEINPLAETDEGTLLALSACIYSDDRAAYRQPRLSEGVLPAGNGWRPFTSRELAMRDVDALDPDVGHIRFHEFDDGEIALMITGGGGGAVAFDTLIANGMRPALTFDISIGDIEEKLYRATQIVLSRPGLKGLIAGSNFTNFAPVEARVRGIVRALQDPAAPVTFPVVLRFCGPDQETAARLAAGLPFVEYLDERVRIDEAVERVIALVRARAGRAVTA